MLPNPDQPLRGFLLGWPGLGPKRSTLTTKDGLVRVLNE
jgi:hypothetical protein